MTKKNHDKQQETEQVIESVSFEELNKALTEENEELIKEAEQAVKKAEHYLNQVNILKKDFDNYKRRTAENLQNAKNDAIAEAVEKFLPTLDTFDRAAQMVKDTETLTSLNLILKQFQKALSETGVVEIDCLDKPFDPAFADALLKTEAGEDKKGIVVQVLAKGYMLKEKVIRHAQVVVGV